MVWYAAGVMNSLMIGLDYCIMMLKSLFFTSISFSSLSCVSVINQYLYTGSGGGRWGSEMLFCCMACVRIDCDTYLLCFLLGVVGLLGMRMRT